MYQYCHYCNCITYHNEYGQCTECGNNESYNKKQQENNTKKSLFTCHVCGNKEDNLVCSKEGYPTVHCCKCKNITSLHIKTACPTEIPNKEYELWE